MILEFEFDWEDMVALQKAHLKNSRFFSGVLWVATLVLPVILGVFLLLDFWQGDARKAVLVVFSITSVLWLIFARKLLWNVALFSVKRRLKERDNSAILGLQVVTVTDEGIHRKGPESESMIQWKGIKEVLDTETHFILYHTAVAALVIPKQKIGSKTDELGKLIASHTN